MEFYTRRNLLLTAQLEFHRVRSRKKPTLLIGCAQMSHQAGKQPTTQMWQVSGTPRIRV